MRQLDTNPVSKGHASVQAISLAAVKAALRTAGLGQIPIDGRINGVADAAWAASVTNIKAHSDVGLKAVLASRSASSAAVPLDGAFHLAYDGRSGVATVSNTFVRTPQTRVDVSGIAGKRLNLQEQAHAGDLRELNSIAAAFQNSATSTNGVPSGALNLGGAADVQVFVEGSMNDPRIRGQLNGRTLQVENTEWRSLDLGFEASKSGVTLQNGSLVNSHQGFGQNCACGLALLALKRG